MKKIVWKEPNRANTPPLHIAASGERFSTVTGIWWLNSQQFVANHRSGQRLALFDLSVGDEPVALCEVPHLNDDVAAKQVSANRWQVAVSGCWASAYSLFELDLEKSPSFKLLRTQRGLPRTFCHGVAYDANGRLWWSYHTGKFPRIRTGHFAWKLPSPWGARDICFDPDNGKAYAVAVSNNPRRHSYQTAQVSIWTFDLAAKKFGKRDFVGNKLGFAGGEWSLLHQFDNMHSDSCQIYRGKLWLPDQLNDKVLGFDLAQKEPDIVIEGSGYFDFPHGLGVSPDGQLAVSNYGSSDITLCDLHDYF